MTTYTGHEADWATNQPNLHAVGVSRLQTAELQIACVPPGLRAPPAAYEQAPAVGEKAMKADAATYAATQEMSTAARGQCASLQAGATACL